MTFQPTVTPFPTHILSPIIFLSLYLLLRHHNMVMSFTLLEFMQRYLKLGRFRSLFRIQYRYHHHHVTHCHPTQTTTSRGTSPQRTYHSDTNYSRSETAVTTASLPDLATMKPCTVSCLKLLWNLGLRGEFKGSTTSPSNPHADVAHQISSTAIATPLQQLLHVYLHVEPRVWYSISC